MRRVGGGEPRCTPSSTSSTTPSRRRAPQPRRRAAACRRPRPTRFLREVRGRSLEVLAADRPRRRRPTRSRADGFVFEMVVEHEAQHTETVLQALQMLPAGAYRPPGRRALPRGRGPAGGWVDGARRDRSAMGADGPGFAYDCERPCHARAVRRLPDRPRPGERRRPPGVHRRRRLRPARALDRRGLGVARGRGRARPRSTGSATARAAGSSAASTSVGAGRPVAAALPRQRPRGRRPRALGRRAAADRGRVGVRRPGRAGAARAARTSTSSGSGRAPVGAYPEAPSGCRGMLGDVWEWTASAFDGYPGFRAFPYPEYAEVFFGPRYRVLRGGSWATQAVAARPSFRNWDLPGAAPDLQRPAAGAGPGVSTGRPPAAVPPRRPSPGRGSGPTGSPATPAAASPPAPKWMPPKHFYDERGSDLFERITRPARVLPGPHRAGDPAPHRARASSPATASASWWSWARGRRARRAALLDAMRDAGRLERYVPFDVCPEAILAAAAGADRGLPRARPPRGRRRLRPPPAGRAAPGGRRRAPGGLPRRHDRQPGAAPSATPFLRSVAGAHGRGRPAAGRHRPRGRPGAHPRRLRRRRGRDGAVQPEPAARDEPRARRRLRPRTPSPTWPSTTRARRGSRCGCARSRDQTVTPRRRST